MKRFNGQQFINVYAGVLTVALTAGLLSGFTSGNNATFDTITVQRINVVEPDGKLRMVLTNNNRIPGIVFQGREYPDFGGRKAATTAGILFYDALATESGGLTFGGNGGTAVRFGHLSFDRYNQDQMFSIDAADDGTNHASSVRMIDQPTWSIEEYLKLLVRIQNLTPEQQQAAIAQFNSTHPSGLGTRTLLSNETYPSQPTASQNGLSLKDLAGKERTHLKIDSNNNAALEFLDANGTVTNRYPPN